MHINNKKHHKRLINNSKRINHYSLLLLFWLIVLIIFFSLNSHINYNNPLINYYKKILNIDDNSPIKNKILHSYPQDIKAEAYMLYDVGEGHIIYSKNLDKKLGLASLSKVMTIYIAKKNCPQVLNTYISRILIESSNDNTDMLADKCLGKDFVNEMNKVSNELGMDFIFYNPTGLPLSENNIERVGNTGSINSFLKLLLILDKEYPDIYQSIFNNRDKLINTNPYLNKWPFLYFSKTGWTSLSGGNLSSIFSITPKDKVIIIVLNSDKENRFQDTYKLLTEYLSGL